MKPTLFFLTIFISTTLIFTTACVETDNFVILKDGGDPENYNVEASFIRNLKVEGDKLLADVIVQGCDSGTFKLIAFDYFLESLPVQADLLLDRSDFDDMCDGEWMEAVQFDLTPLKTAYRMTYPDNVDKGTIQLNVLTSRDPEKYISVEYNFSLGPIGCS